MEILHLLFPPIPIPPISIPLAALEVEAEAAAAVAEAAMSMAVEAMFIAALVAMAMEDDPISMFEGLFCPFFEKSNTSFFFFLNETFLRKRHSEQEGEREREMFEFETDKSSISADSGQGRDSRPKRSTDVGSQLLLRSRAPISANQRMPKHASRGPGAIASGILHSENVLNLLKSGQVCSSLHVVRLGKGLECANV